MHIKLSYLNVLLEACSKVLKITIFTMKQPEVILHRDFGHRQVFWQPNPNLGNTHGVEQSRPIYPTEHFSAEKK